MGGWQLVEHIEHSSQTALAPQGLLVAVSPIRVQSSTVVGSGLFSSLMVVFIQELTPKASVFHRFPWYLQCLVLIFRIGVRPQSLKPTSVVIVPALGPPMGQYWASTH